MNMLRTIVCAGAADRRREFRFGANGPHQLSKEADPADRWLYTGRRHRPRVALCRAVRCPICGARQCWSTTGRVRAVPSARSSVARAAPDGYTIMLCTIGSHAITPARITLPYDHIKDFSFLSKIGSTPNLFIAHPAQPFKNVGDVVAYAKANPGKLSFGSSGVGASPHLSIELLKSMTGHQHRARAV